jgi:hypothetical protein
MSRKANMIQENQGRHLTAAEGQRNMNKGVSLTYTECEIYASLRYVTVRGEGKLETARREQAPYALSLPLPPRTAAGWP